MPIDIAPAMSSATPPRTTSLDSPREDRPAVRAKGTVRPSERPITLGLYEDKKLKKKRLKRPHTSRTMSGSMSVRSSAFSSLQQMPSWRLGLAQLAGKGTVTPERDEVMGHTGAAFVGFGSREGRGTEDIVVGVQRNSKPMR